MLNSKDFPLGFPRSVRSGSILYSGPMVNLPSPSAPGFSVSAAAAPAAPASRAMRVIVPSNRAESLKINIVDMDIVKTLGAQVHKRKILGNISSTPGLGPVHPGGTATRFPDAVDGRCSSATWHHQFQ